MGRKVACYLSAEFLMGLQLGNNLLNLGIENEVRAPRLPRWGRISSRSSAARPSQPGSNGGLGRLAACYLDRWRAANACRLRHPLRIRHFPAGNPRRLWQAEVTLLWLRYGNPWKSPEVAYYVTSGVAN